MLGTKSLGTIRTERIWEPGQVREQAVYRGRSTSTYLQPGSYLEQADYLFGKYLTKYELWHKLVHGHTLFRCRTGYDHDNYNNRSLMASQSPSRIKLKRRLEEEPWLIVTHACQCEKLKAQLWYQSVLHLLGFLNLIFVKGPGGGEIKCWCEKVTISLRH